MSAVISCLNVWKKTVASCNLGMKRNVLITKGLIAFVPRKFASSVTKVHLLSDSSRLNIFGSLCRCTTRQSRKLSVLLSFKDTERLWQHCSVSIAVTVGLLVGWMVLQLHQHTASCVAETTDTVECHHDNKEQTNQQCHSLSLEEAIYESDQLLQRVKVGERERENFIHNCTAGIPEGL